MESQAEQASQSSAYEETTPAFRTLNSSVLRVPDDLEGARENGWWGPYLAEIEDEPQATAFTSGPSHTYDANMITNDYSMTSAAEVWLSTFSPSGHPALSITQLSSNWVSNYTPKTAGVGLAADAYTMKQKKYQDLPCLPRLPRSTYSSSGSDFLGPAYEVTGAANDLRFSAPAISSFEISIGPVPLLPPEIYSAVDAEAIKAVQDFAPEIKRSSGHILASLSKNQKLAHSLVERNYRSRITSGLAELRHCVPRTNGHDLSHNSNYVDGLGSTQDSQQSHSSGKAAILTDAVHYIKALEHQSRLWSKHLSILQRRHDVLQKIALAKIGPNTFPGTTSHELDKEGAQPLPEALLGLQQTKRKRKPPPCRASSRRSPIIH